ncbi:TMEM175 family protein [Methylocystis sp. IM3]|uniref:TMEM175 family protein n=1 Tax=unclassified Methylocystis TaxID=2625913 RepID=UPI0030F93DC8
MTQDRETHRIESFSDGVFAIAITLLVLEIKVPSQDTVATRGMTLALLDNWPSYLAFLISFITILVIWSHHHWIFAAIRRADLVLVYWNGLLLLFVTFIPFPTGLLSEYLLHPEAKVAASLYTGTFLAISLVFQGLWLHASKQGKLLAIDATTSEEENALRITSHYKLGPILYFGAFATSFITEIGSVTMCLLLALFFAFRGWPSEVRMI